MEKNPLKIKLEDLPDEYRSLSEETEIILDDHDEMMDDEFWSNGENATDQ